MDKMAEHFAQQVMDAFDFKDVVPSGEEITMEMRVASGQAKYNSWFGTVAKRRVYGKYMETVNMLLETTVSEETMTTYEACIVTY